MAEKISNRYLLSMVWFLAGPPTLIKGFEDLVKSGPTIPLVIKLAICFGFFIPACIVINKHNYFQDVRQHKLVMKLQFSFRQVLIALAALFFWVFMRISLFGSK